MEIKETAGTHDCEHAAGVFEPIINRERCEGKADCLQVCPYDVFALAALTKEQRSALSFGGRLKLWVHGGRQAIAASADQCRACGLCVAACPEKAILLRKRG